MKTTQTLRIILSPTTALKTGLVLSVTAWIICVFMALSACSKATDGISQGSTQTSLPPGRTIDTRCFDSNGLQVPCPILPRR